MESPHPIQNPRPTAPATPLARDRIIGAFHGERMALRVFRRRLGNDAADRVRDVLCA